MKTSNPVLSSRLVEGYVVSDQNEGVMTIRGACEKTLLLVAICFAMAGIVWYQFAQGNVALASNLIFPATIGGFILALVTMFKRNLASWTSPLYAACQGVALGSISCLFEIRYPGIAIEAVTLTFLTLTAMLLAYRFEWIRVTEQFKAGLFAATAAIAILYFVSWILSFFSISVPFLVGSSTGSIMLSVVVVVIAALNLVLDFDMIVQGARRGLPKQSEWFAAFGLMVTLVWLYLEILNLLAKARDRK